MNRHNYAGYKIDGCRCEICKAAVRDYNRRRAQNPEPSFVPAQPVRDHVTWLSSQGVGWKTVAKRSGVPVSTLSKLLYSINGKPPSKRVRPETRDKILAVFPDQGADASLVPAAPVWADIEQLRSLGWTKTAIAQRIHGPQARALQIGRDLVTRRNAAAVRALLDEVLDRVEVPVEITRAKAQVRSDEYDELCATLAGILEDRITQASWRASAACRGKAPWVFFPARGDYAGLRAAVTICRSCTVRRDCLAANLDERDGVYGGLSGKQRRALRAQRDVVAA